MLRTAAALRATSRSAVRCLGCSRSVSNLLGTAPLSARVDAASFHSSAARWAMSAPVSSSSSVSSSAPSSSSVSSVKRLRGYGHPVCAVLGAQWATRARASWWTSSRSSYDVIARFNGGSNAGHTLVVDGRQVRFPPAAMRAAVRRQDQRHRQRRGAAPAHAVGLSCDAAAPTAAAGTMSADIRATAPGRALPRLLISRPRACAVRLPSDD